MALIFHWPLSELQALELEDLIHWRNLAVEKWNQINPKAE